jgi:hypothetical protein
VQRRDELAALADEVGRSIYFTSSVAGKLAALDRLDLADKVVDALVQLDEVHLQLLKLSRGATPTPGREHSFDSANKVPPF